MKTSSKNEVITSKYWFSFQGLNTYHLFKVKLCWAQFEFSKRKKLKYPILTWKAKQKVENRKRERNVNNKTSTRNKERRVERRNGNKRQCRVVSSRWKDSILVQSTGLVEGETKSGYNENNTKHALMNLHLVKNEWFAIYVNPNGAITFIHIKWNVRNIHLLTAPATTTTAMVRKLHENEFQDNVARVVKEKKSEASSFICPFLTCNRTIKYWERNWVAGKEELYNGETFDRAFSW